MSIAREHQKEENKTKKEKKKLNKTKQQQTHIQGIPKKFTLQIEFRFR